MRIALLALVFAAPLFAGDAKPPTPAEVKKSR